MVEVIAATVIATLAVLGLAYTFGMGRGLIDRYEGARIALAAAEGRVEILQGTSAADTVATPDRLHRCQVLSGNAVIGTEYWLVQWIDDPADSLAPHDLNPRDLRKATVTVVFRQGAVPDSIQLVRYLPAL